MTQDNSEPDSQLQLDALWTSLDDQTFETRWNLLSQSLVEPMRTAIERASRWRSHPTGKSLDEILVEDAFALSQDKLSKAARKMKTSSANPRFRLQGIAKVRAQRQSNVGGLSSGLKKENGIRSPEGLLELSKPIRITSDSGEISSIEKQR